MSQQPQPQYPPPPVPQQYQMHVQQPVTDKSKRFLNLSTGALIAVVTTILLVCCIGPIALCLFSPFLSAITDIGKTPPAVSITSCQIEDAGFASTATVAFTLTNKSQTSESYLVKIEVRDSGGARVGDGSEYVSSVGPGKSASEEATLFLDAKGGVSCHIVDAS